MFSGASCNSSPLWNGKWHPDTWLICLLWSKTIKVLKSPRHCDNCTLSSFLISAMSLKYNPILKPPHQSRKNPKHIQLTWTTGTVQECELELPKQPGEVSQGPANLLTFLGTRRERVGGWRLTADKRANRLGSSAMPRFHQLMTEIFPDLR